MKWLVLIGVLVVMVGLATRGVWLRPSGDRPAPSPASSAPTPAECRGPEAFREAARVNARDYAETTWAPFKVEERGWDAYAPVIARQIGADCPPDSPGFAAALARWQAQNGLPAAGRMDAATFEKMRVAWMLNRPFVVATRQGQCPAAPQPYLLADARPQEGYRGKPIQLRPATLTAYRRMVAAARREVPGLAADPDLLTVVSGFRDPRADAARCVTDGNCGGPARANCSAHLTGLAMDINVGSAPGEDVTSTSDSNRSWQARTALYAWLARNAERYGFVGYPYEPWHWEWTGEPVTP